MLATFSIEIVLALYTVWRFKLNIVGRLITALLFFLGFFQLSEYFVCGGLGMSSVGWARAGYVAISTLPPLGLHLMYTLAGKKPGKTVYAAYGTMVLFMAWFLLYGGAFAGYVCTGNYVIFQLVRGSAILYGTYYYGWLLTAIVLAIRWTRAIGRNKKRAQQGRNMMMLVFGYLVFLLPTAIANTVSPETRRGIPSIMCGFAILFALVLVSYILPRAGQVRNRS